MGFTDGTLGQVISQGPIGGGFTGPKPQLDPTALPASAKPLLDAQQAQGTMSTQDVVNRNMQGTGQADQFQRSPEQTARMSAALGMDPNTPMSQAIAQRAQHAYGANLAALNTRQQLEAPTTLAQQQHGALQAQLGQQQFLNKQYSDQLGAYMNQQAARSKAISSIFQLGGLLGGRAAASSRSQKEPGDDNANYYGNGGSSSVDTGNSSSRSSEYRMAASSE